MPTLGPHQPHRHRRLPHHPLVLRDLMDPWACRDLQDLTGQRGPLDLPVPLVRLGSLVTLAILLAPLVEMVPWAPPDLQEIKVRLGRWVTLVRLAESEIQEDADGHVFGTFLLV